MRRSISVDLADHGSLRTASSPNGFVPAHYTSGSSPDRHLIGAFSSGAGLGPPHGSVRGDCSEPRGTRSTGSPIFAGPFYASGGMSLSRPATVDAHFVFHGDLAAGLVVPEDLFHPAEHLLRSRLARSGHARRGEY